MILPDQGQQVHIIAQKDLPGIDPPPGGAVLQFQHTTGADRGADPAAHTTGTDNVLPPLGIGAHIDAHFAIGGTVATADALSPVGRDPKTGEQLLLEAQDGRHGTAETAPDPGAEKGVEAGADYPGKDASDQKAIGFTQGLGPYRKPLAVPAKGEDDQGQDDH